MQTADAEYHIAHTVNFKILRNLSMDLRLRLKCKQIEIPRYSCSNLIHFIIYTHLDDYHENSNNNKITD